ncbi:signal recognition particle-docking protein FtsY [Funiculus sociatus GB2-A5]|uniref:Signal recognition particle receptor FtsY n=1 Tax=Funiculus sociatus GB2-A5 TaxID=2933946 RepID=A0ABV0JN82_9CYAN|nr:MULTISPECIES: signal recognition particle-docking protein FtsY [unclassified Trichocoleus]MBD1906404.1 signal recognition particle-docking protein FtsY [Trichocoleus sp. FACHB-832]MBD2064959.1 signal recognition particle-docking protein FtsY [Trichocoleus sp. FACHB-6]
MVFNWFRRQFSNSESDSQVEQQQSDQIQPSAEPETSESTQEQSPGVSEDLLRYAKAAYKNIQQKQEQAEPEAAPDAGQEPSADVPDTAEVSESPDTLIDTAAETASLEVEDDLAASATSEAIASEPAAEQINHTNAEVEEETTPESAQEVEAIAETGVVIAPEAPEPETESAIAETGVVIAPDSVETQTEEAPPTPVPFWAKEDRQARLERLKATAIEAPEPERVQAPVQPAATAVTEEVPGLAFDEGFMWSAQVLATQGRRAEDVSIEEITWLKRLRQGLDKTRRSLINQLKAIVGQGPLNQDAVMEIEALLLQADVGIEATDYIIKTLQDRLREEVLPPDQAIAYLKKILRDLLDKPIQESYSPTFVPTKDTLNIWLMTGVNGAGKTTTIGKIAHLAQKSGYKCLIGAADTFRAAAVEQVKIWGQRSAVEVIANPGQNTDPAAVVFDAITAAQARGTELLLIDTAGRLQNKKNLMEELGKIRRIVDKKAPNAQIEALLVLDATLGQNGLRQAEVFSQAAKLSGVVLTKLDGTAKGGVALAVVQQLGLPIRFIGAGEGVEDLRPFSSYEFVEALLSG